MRKFLKCTAFWALLVLGIPVFTSDLWAQTTANPPVAAEPPAVEAPAVAEDTFNTMIGAIENNKYAQFVSLANPTFKAALKPEIFKALVAQLGPRLEGGHEFRYLGALKQAGYTVSLWRVRFKDGGDDLLGQVSENDTGVGGFFLR